MDGLSVGASVAGLVQVASKVVQFISTMSGASSTARNVLAEARSLQAILHQLQDFIIRFDQGLHDQRSMIYVNQLVTTLTGCVCAFNDLEKVLDSLNTSHDASALLRLWCSAKWALKDPDLSRILGDLQKHKSSLNLMLTIITCESAHTAQRHMEQLVQSVERVLRTDANLSTRMSTTDFPQGCAHASDIPSVRSASTIATVSNLPKLVVFSFESALAKARVYQNVVSNTSTRSFKSIVTSETMWSQLSGLSLSQISNISVICLPIYAHELRNSYFFDHHQPKASDGSTVLHDAAATGHTSTVQLLVKNVGANKDAMDSSGWTALHYAAFHGHNNTVRSLIVELGANKEAKDSNGATALHHAAYKGHHRTVWRLISLSVDKESKDNIGSTALHQAAYRGHNSTVQMLAKLGVNMEAQSRNGWTALHCAAYTGQDTTVILLVKTLRLNKEAKDKNGGTPLRYAAFNGHVNTVRILIEFGVDKEAKDNEGSTALHLAAYNGHKSTVWLLVRRGAGKEARNSDGSTALHHAAYNGHDSIIRLLVKLGVDKEAKDYDGWTAVHYAAFNGHNATIRLFAELGVDMDVKTYDSQQRTALHYAAYNGHCSTVQLLIALGVDKESTASDGTTVLHSAASNGHDATVRQLVQLGIDTEARDHEETTALHCATTRGHDSTARLLAKLGRQKRILVQRDILNMATYEGPQVGRVSETPHNLAYSEGDNFA